VQPQRVLGGSGAVLTFADFQQNNNYMNNLTPANVALNQALKDLQLDLTDLVQSARWQPIIQAAFGDGLSVETAQRIQQAWVGGDFSDLKIAIATTDALGGANGAYVNGDRSIYLSEGLLQTNNLGLVKSVLLEEVGHYLDDRFNDGKDTPGEEGELFSKLAQNITVDPAKIAELKAKDDHANININGQLVAAELAAGDYINANLASLKTGIDSFFNKVKTQIQSIVTTDLSNLKTIPLAGNKISTITTEVGKDALDFLQSVQDKIDEKFTQAAGSSELIKTGLAEAFGNSGLGILKDTNSDGVADAKDIILTETADNLQVNLTLETKPKAINDKIETNFDVGTTGLGLKGAVKLDTNFGATLNLGFGFSNDNGFYIDTKDQSELTVNLGMSLPTLDLEGDLGPFKSQITSGAGGAGYIKTGLVVDLKADTFDRIYGNDVGSLTVAKNLKTKIGGSAGLSLHAETKVDPSLPSLTADIDITWADFIAKATPTGKFKNVILDSGTFVSAFNPILKTIQDINKPVKKIVDLFNTKLPLIGGTVLDLADTLDTLLTANKSQNAEFVKDFIALSDLIDKSTGFGGKTTLIGEAGVIIPFSVDPNAIEPLAAPTLTSAGKDVLDQLGANPNSKAFADILKNNPTLQIPLLTDPLATIPSLLTGKPNTNLITFKLPTLQTGFEFSQYIPILGPIGVDINGGLGAAVNLTFGYDTTGWSTYRTSGNATDIAKGLFLSGNKLPTDPYNLFPPEGNKYDEFIVGLGGKIGADLTVNIGIGSIGIGGGLNASLKLVPADPSGKVRVNDLANPGCILLPHGSMGAYFGGKLKLGFGPFSIKKSIVIARVKLLDFTAECDSQSHKAAPGVATNNNGVLVLQTTNAADNFLVRHNLATDSGTVSIFGNEIVEVDNAGVLPIYNGVKSITNDKTKTDGNDTIILDPGVLSPADFAGGAGDDQLDGGAGNDALYGEANDDVLTGNGGNDSLYGGDGDDALSGGAGSDLLDGGAGSNFVSYASDPKRIVALSTGFSTFNVFDGYGGQDNVINVQQLEGSNFGDFIRLAQSNQNLVVFGLDGNDYIKTGTANDFLLGGEGADILDGNDGEDGTSYADSWDGVDVNLANSFAYGGTASGDRLFNIEDVQGSFYDDVLTGNASNNRLDGNGGDDTIEGGAGADTLTGGGGTDLVTYKGSANGVRVNIADNPPLFGTFGGDATGDILASKYGDPDGFEVIDLFENLEGSQFDDVLVGNEYRNVIYGLSGDDNLAGANGNDTLVGGAGADRFDGGSDSDEADYSVSSSDRSLRATVGVVVDLTATGSGGDAQGDTFATTVVNGNTVSTVENLRGTDVGDRLFGDAGNNILIPGLGIDFVDGRGVPGTDVDTLVVDYGIEDTGTGIGALTNFTYTANSVITRWDNNGNIKDQVTYQNIESLRLVGTIKEDKVGGTNGNDFIDAQDGDDLIEGFSGNDELIGGDGKDRIFGDSGSDDLSGGNGDDDLFGGAGNDFMRGGEGDDYIDGGDGKDYIYGEGGNDTIDGGDIGNDTSGGSLGNYTLDGGDGNDVITGGNGNEIILGGSGDDKLAGSAIFENRDYFPGFNKYAGQDTITGGTGADQFWLDYAENGANNYTTITDYNPTEGDKIVVRVTKFDFNTEQTSARTTLGDGKVYSLNPALGLIQYGGVDSPFFLKQVGNDVQIFNATNFGTLPQEPQPQPQINSVSLVDGTQALETSPAIVPLAVALPTPDLIAVVQNTTIDKIVLTIPSQLTPAPLAPVSVARLVTESVTPIVTSDNASVPLVTEALPAFQVTQTSDATALLAKFLGTTGLDGLKNIKAKLVGDSRAFGTFTNDPFGLNAGLVLSTGRVKDLPGANVQDGSKKTFNTDLSTSLGSVANISFPDKVSLEIEFETDETNKNLYFQYVFGSEELLEFGGSKFNDSFKLFLNGQSLAKLSDAKGVYINNLAKNPGGIYHPDLIINSTVNGPAKDITKLDAYTKLETFVGKIKTGKNKLVINIADAADGIYDSAVFLKANSFTTILPPDLTIGGADAVIITPKQIEVTEGNPIANSFEIKLKGTIASPVSITITPDPQVYIGTGIDPNSMAPITLTFDPTNSDVAQTIFVKAIDDNVIQGKRTVPISITTSSADTRFNNLAIAPEQIIITDNDLPTVTITASQDATEGSIDGSFTVTLNAPAPSGGLTVRYNLAGVATTPADYSLAAGTNISAVTANSFTIAAGQTTATVKAIALNDNLLDPNEDVQLQLQASPDYLLGTANKSLNIIDNPLRASVAPTGTDKTVTLNEDSSYAFTVADFGFSDAADTPVHNFTQVKITTLPTAGNLKLGANAVNVGDLITVANIPQLNFSPVANTNGAAYAKFSFQVQDDGGTANGGANLDPTPNAITFDVTPVNDLAKISGISTGSVTKNTSVNVTNRTFSDKLTVTDLDTGEAKFKTVVTPVGVTLGAVAIDEAGNYKYTVANSAIQGLLQGQTKVETFTVQSFDSSASQKIDITINGVNDINASSTNTAQIKGSVWNDLNGSTNRDGVEPGLANWQVYLDLNGNGQLDATDTSTLTGNDGTYQFTGLSAGTYTINEVLQPNWKQTFPVVGPLSTTAADIALFTPDIAVDGTTTTTGTTNPTELVQIDKLAQDSRFANIKGQGLTTVVIDTGIDVNHPLFGADKNGDGIADRIVYQYDFADNDTDASDKTGHGSHVSSIISSIAPDSNIIALKVFKNDGTGSFANLENALQWVANNAKTYNVGAVNISLGDGSNWNTAESRYGLGDEFAALASQNIITSAATGNSFFQDISLQGNAYPAADPNVIGVGAVWATGATTPQKFVGGAIDYTAAPDRIASFSQRSSTLNDVFAPGIFINGANATGGTSLLGGTSQSTAFVSGIATLAQQIAQSKLGRKLTVSEFRNLLATTSTPIKDGDDENTNVNASNLTFPRINALALAEGILKLTPATPAENLPPATGNSLPTPPALKTYAVSQKIILADGQISSGIDFGNQIIPNRPPTLTGSLFTLPNGFEDNLYNFTTANLTQGYTDPDGDLINVNGVNITNGVVANNSGIYTFTPTLNYNGAVNLTYNLDDGKGGITPVTKSLNLAPVNDLPAGIDKSINLLEDSSYTLTATDFGFADTNDTPANSLIAVKISSLASTGTLKLNNVAIAIKDVISIADINGGKLSFSSAPNVSGSANFTFQVQDNGGIANGGIDLDATPNTITFNVTPVNDAPTGTDKNISLLEDSSYTLTATDFGFTDTSDTPANTLTAVKISSLASPGSLKLGGAAVNLGAFISVVDINAGDLRFTPVANANGNNYSNFTFQVQDNGGVINGGVDLDATPNTITFNVTSVNDAPSGTETSISLLEDNTYTLTAADFGFTDPNDTPANNLSAVKISTLASAGALKLNNIAVVATDVVSIADITAGNLTFTPVANANGNNYAKFTFQVQDNGGIANGGIDLDATPNTIVFNVTPVNDAPVITVGATDKSTGSVTEIADGALGENVRNLNTTGTLTITDVDFSDVQTVAVIPKGTPYTGTFTPIITDSTTGDGKGQITWSFSVLDKDIDSLAAGQVLTQTYSIIANDGQGGIASQDVTITINGTNDAPTVAHAIGNQTICKCQPLNFTIPADTFQDVDLADKLTYSATLENGKPLPDWLKLNSLTGEFSGTPTKNFGDYDLIVTATDPAGATAKTNLTFVGKHKPQFAGIDLDQNLLTTNHKIAGFGIHAVSHKNGSKVSEIGAFAVDDETGKIGDVEFGSAGYLKAATDSAKTILSALDGSFFNPNKREMGLDPDKNYEFFEVQDGSIQDVQKQLANGQTPTNVLFARPDASGNSQFKVTPNSANDGYEISVNNDELVLNVTKLDGTAPSMPIGAKSQSLAQGRILDLSDYVGKILKADLTTTSSAAYNNNIAFYAIEDAVLGTIKLANGTSLNPNDANYGIEAVKNALATAVLQAGKNDSKLNQDLTGGKLYAPVLIAQGSLTDFVSKNPTNGGDGKAVHAYFNYLGANPDKLDHFRLLGNNNFGVEDLYGGGDRDFNDVVVNINIKAT
jgi:VCBS repeat-containing protein